MKHIKRYEDFGRPLYQGTAVALQRHPMFDTPDTTPYPKEADEDRSYEMGRREFYQSLLVGLD